MCIFKVIVQIPASWLLKLWAKLLLGLPPASGESWCVTVNGCGLKMKQVHIYSWDKHHHKIHYYPSMHFCPLWFQIVLVFCKKPYIQVREFCKSVFAKVGKPLWGYDPDLTYAVKSRCCTYQSQSGIFHAIHETIYLQQVYHMQLCK